MKARSAIGLMSAGPSTSTGNSNGVIQHDDEDDDQDDAEDDVRMGETMRRRARAESVEVFSVKDPPRKRTRQPNSKASTGGAGGSSMEKSEVQRARMATLPSAPLDVPTSILDSRHVADVDESYSENEKALCNFLKLHPMLSLDATNEKVLTTASNLLSEFEIPLQELEVTTKKHDDLFFRRAKESLGERPCTLGDKCLCRWLAIFRFGDNAEQAFTCREFLLPSQHDQFLKSGKLPKTQGKCLVCCRYFTHFTYNLARTSPTFNPTSAVQLQAFGSKIGVPDGCVTITPCETGNEDGYKPSVMLFVDETWADQQSSRTSLGALLWRPTVRFCSRDYKYVKEPDTGEYVLIQVGMGMNDTDPHFGQPAVSEEQEQRACA